MGDIPSNDTDILRHIGEDTKKSIHHTAEKEEEEKAEKTPDNYHSAHRPVRCPYS
jgi:hypothetical protein